MAKKKSEPEQLTFVQLACAIVDRQELSSQIKGLEKQKKALDEKILSAIGKGGSVSIPDWKVTVVSPKRRSVPWKEICFKLAKKLYDSKALRAWLRGLVRDYPKKPIASSLRFTARDEEREALEAK